MFNAPQFLGSTDFSVSPKNIHLSISMLSTMILLFASKEVTEKEFENVPVPKLKCQRKETSHRMQTEVTIGCHNKSAKLMLIYSISSLPSI